MDDPHGGRMIRRTASTQSLEQTVLLKDWVCLPPSSPGPAPRISCPMEDLLMKQGVTEAPLVKKDAPPPPLNTATRMASASGMFGTTQDLAKYAAGVLAASKPVDAGPSEYNSM